MFSFSPSSAPLKRIALSQTLQFSPAAFKWFLTLQNSFTPEFSPLACPAWNYMFDKEFRVEAGTWLRSLTPSRPNFYSVMYETVNNISRRRPSPGHPTKRENKSEKELNVAKLKTFLFLMMKWKINSVVWSWWIWKRWNGEEMDGEWMGVSVKMEAASSNFTLLIELFTEGNFDELA